MSQDWETLAANSGGLHVAADFEIAAYRLVADQVIYYADLHSRTAYSIVDRYERNFKDVLSSLGIDVQVNRQLRYAFARPRHEKAGIATVAQTLFALVLRAIYDESVRAGQMTDDGDVVCDPVELEERYRLMTGREFPSKAEIDALLRTMKRWGIAKKSDDQAIEAAEDAGASPYFIFIRPAIADILGETAMARLIQWKAAADAGQPAEGEPDEEQLPETNGSIAQ